MSLADAGAHYSPETLFTNFDGGDVHNSSLTGSPRAIVHSKLHKKELQSKSTKSKIYFNPAFTSQPKILGLGKSMVIGQQGVDQNSLGGSE